MTELTELAIDPAGDAAALTPAPGALGRMEDVPVWRRLAAYAFLLLAEFFYGWAWNSVDVLRPAIRDSLHLSLTQAGSGYSSQGAGALIGAVVIGQLADRLGRRLMLAVVMVGYGSSLLGGAFVGDLTAYLVQRFVLGLFMGGIFSIVVGIYAGLFQARFRGRMASGINAIFSASIVALGLAYGALGGRDWRLLLVVGGLPPILLAFVAYVVVPDQRRYSAFGADPNPTVPVGRLPISQLFAPGVRRQTLLLATMTGLNFFAYQAFSGWFTTYLKDARALAPATIGAMVAWQFGGNIVGGFFWGVFSDRFGRRANAIGFVLAAVGIVAFLVAPSRPPLLIGLGAAYGFCLACSVAWGPWLAELYPEHLRSTAGGIFNWGRIVSFFAPIVTGEIAGRFGLAASMLTACAVFLIAAAIWFSLPETLDVGRRRDRPAPA